MSAVPRYSGVTLSLLCLAAYLAVVPRPAVAGDTAAIIGGIAAGWLTYELLDSLDDHRGCRVYCDSASCPIYRTYTYVVPDTCLIWPTGPWYRECYPVPVPSYRVEYHYYYAPPCSPPRRVYRESRPLPRDDNWRYWSPMPGRFYGDNWPSGPPPWWNGPGRSTGYVEGEKDQRQRTRRPPGHLW